MVGVPQVGVMYMVDHYMCLGYGHRYSIDASIQGIER